MKITVMNGWTDAPNYWWRYLLVPLGWDKNPAWLSINFFGFVFFIYESKPQMKNFTVFTSPSGVSHVYCGNDIFCSVHHGYVGSFDKARERAESIAKLLNEANA